MSDLRVLHIASGDLWAGAEVMLFRIAVAQAALPGVHAAVILFNEGKLADELRAAAIPLWVFPESTHNAWQLLIRCRAAIRSHGAHIVHTHRIKEDVLGGVAAASAGAAKFVRTVHGVDEVNGQKLSWSQKLARGVHRACIRSLCDATFAVSEPLRAELARSFPGHRVEYVANGMDVHALPASHRSSSPSGPVRVGLIGRLAPIKRVDLFIEMAGIVERQAPSACEFHVYGAGPEEGALRSQAEAAGLGQRIVFHGFSSSIETELAKLDLLYLTSDSEGLPMVLLEAMAAHVPVVAHAVGEIPAVLDGGNCGTLVSSHTAAGYSAALLAYLQDPNPFRERAELAYRRVSQQYSAQASASSYVDYYRQIVQS